MAIVNTFSCDVCFSQKKTNSWWKVFLLDMDQDNSPAGVLILKFEVDAITRPKELGGGFQADRANAHVCGIECLQKYMSKEVTK